MDSDAHRRPRVVPHVYEGRHRRSSDTRWAATAQLGKGVTLTTRLVLAAEVLDKHDALAKLARAIAWIGDTIF